MTNALIQIENVTRHFPAKGSLEALLTKGQTYVQAVDGVSFEIRQKEILGLVGESGCGKSTLGGLLGMLDTPTHGVIRFRDFDITQMVHRAREMKKFRRKVQMILQQALEAGILVEAAQQKVDAADQQDDEAPEDEGVQDP